MKIKSKVQHAIFAPLNEWLTLLVAGWEFADWIIQPMPFHHGQYSVLMVK